MDFPVLLTERLKLRQLSEDDNEEIFLLRSDATINKYLNRQPSKTTEDTLAFIKNIIKNDNLYWAITEKDKDKLIGTVCLFEFDSKMKKCEIGYELSTEYQGKGFMHESIKKVIDYSTQTLEFKIIDAITHKDNQSSIKLLKNLNFLKTEIDEAEPNLISFRFVEQARTANSA